MQSQVQLAIVQQHKTGKMVSVATIKNKVASQIPLPFITKEVSLYKTNPSAYVEQHNHLVGQAAPSQPIENKTNETNNQEQKISALEQRVAQLEQTVASLVEKLAATDK
ncbi:hypothetical protein C2869_01715 [Saccharobesus litoralis]|uniref:Uncharacterized protein n=1 Tax=Saccharobesus litoralis TaxID=2172099 RepID=A0A2S0VM18_9ALTE|nr:hypothetical protein [Saccharobesus litoralis]AWB65239.1 hypothetical protein C2869_01715 [Saccharobesus litoralis]